MIFWLLATHIFLWCWKIKHQFILDWLMRYPNCNLVLNYAGSPRRFSSHELHDEKYHFYENWPENLTTTLVSMVGVLLEVRNRKEGCRAWGLVATTSHDRTLSMLLFQDSTHTSITLFVLSFRYTTWLGLGILNSNQVHFLILSYHRAISLFGS
jgi:hypothetical protein